jgi:pyridinium-3,5-biscarboxylic acid mononucleotide sulfurtransferase
MIDIKIDKAESSTASKFSDLQAELRQRLLNGGLVIAFSGGVDSAFLLWAAEQERLRSGGELLALTTQSASFSQAERFDVEKFIEQSGVRHVWQDSNELLNPDYTINDTDRCFHCKTELFTICKQAASESGLKWIAYGYNASDQGDTRPGHRAALENGIISPLADARLTKDDIRELMRENSLEMAEKPASPCLSSRLMTGVHITPRKLQDVEEIETILRNGGVRVFRVRMHEDGNTKFLRIEVAADEMETAMKLRDHLVREGKARGYKWVVLDLAGYSTGGGNLPSR